MSTSIAARIQNINNAIIKAINDSQRSLDDVTLMAVTKGRSLEDITAAVHAGIVHFGENYWQEAEKKIAHFKDHPLIWHFIGKIQKNKARAIANAVQWVDSLDDLAVANSLSKHRLPSLPPLNVCIQVNLQQELTKSGLAPSDLLSFASELITMPQLCLRGLMIIPKPTDDEHAQYTIFSQLAELKDYLSQALHIPLDTLSMGMSNDFHAAIQAGSTMVRIGQLIFEETST